MGGGVPSSGRRPSHAAYFVALGGILALLLLLCCYFLYFFVRKVHELREHPSLSALPNNPVKPLITPAVRDSATAMAKLCKQLPAGGQAVFPAAASPEPHGARTRTDPQVTCPRPRPQDSQAGPRVRPSEVQAPEPTPLPPPIIVEKLPAALTHACTTVQP